MNHLSGLSFSFVGSIVKKYIIIIIMIIKSCPVCLHPYNMNSEFYPYNGCAGQQKKNEM